MKKVNWKKVFGITAATAGVAFIIASIIAKKKKKDSIYNSDCEEKNPFEGKKVVFVYDDNEPENADGVKGHLEAVGDSDYKEGFYSKHIKRWIDIVLSFGGLIVLSPILLGISIAIIIDDPGPVLFTQKRVGKNKQFFKLHKFRSMKMSTPHDVPTHQLENPEQYITKVGKFLRAHSLDELPQIWDIFIGNMSIIGPRPGLWNQDLLTAERDKYNANDVCPGLTGWAQINGRDELEIPAKAKLDGEYVKKLGFLMDVKCFLGSLHVFKNDNSVVEGGTGELNKDKNNKKKILVICQYYKPEPFRISDICEGLVQKGHEVHVVTGYPNYPEGVIYNGYGKGKHIDEMINGVSVHRCYTIARSTGVIKRFLNYYSFVISSIMYVLSSKCSASDGKKFDVVFCNQLSPVMMAEAAIMYKRKYKVPLVLYCLDLWPESLVAGGVSKKSIIYKVFLGVSRHIYINADKILITSRMFRLYLNKKFGINNDIIEYLPQYAEDIFEPIPYKRNEQIINVMFAGNIGEIQSVETIILAASKLQNYPVHFHIVGGGTDLDRIKSISNNINNISFYGRCPIDAMPNYYAMADAMLVTLKKDPVLCYTLPGKVQSYMAAGKPIIGAIDGETCEIINDAKCGFCGPSEDYNKLAENIINFIDCDNKEQMCYNSRHYYEVNFDKDLFIDKLEYELIN